MHRSKNVEEYLGVNHNWETELIKLRKIMLATEMEETIKWGVPVYTVNGKNIVGLAAFKSYVGIWFYQGAFLKDEKKKLFNAQEGKTKALRQWRFESAKDIIIKDVKAYVIEAIKNQKDGKEIKPERNKEVIIPKELEEAFAKNKKLEDSFNTLSLSKRREYAEHISSAKREATKSERIKKITPMILEKKGLHDKYKNC